MPTSPLVEVHRRDLLSLANLATADLAALFRQLDGTPDEVRDALMEILPQLVQVYGSAAASLAADWYDEMREVDEVPGRFRAIPVELPDSERTDSLARWGVGPLFNDEFVGRDEDGQSIYRPLDPAEAIAIVRAKVSGGLQRIVADAGRQTILRSIDEDPRGGGWSRATTSGSCDFCQMIARRGAVYSAKTADFASHDDCDCVAVPVFGDEVKVKDYTPSQKFKTQEQRDANNARVREHLDGKESTTRKGSGRKPAKPAQVDRDASRTTAQLRDTLASLERSLEKFESPGTRKRVEDLRRKIAARN